MATSSLPQISRFLAGLVTNRNPLFTPFSVLGMNIIRHSDALIDGENMEVTAYDTLARRPGFSVFLSGFSEVVNDFFQYKDLDGNISLFYDVDGDLYNGTTKVANSLNGSPWTVVAAGNFVYAANGKNAIRLKNDSLTVAGPIGIGALQSPPAIKITTAAKQYFLSSFIPTDDTISGLLVIEDGNNSRQLTITINTASVHFNVTYSGNAITPNQKYTETTIQTQSGTAPNTTTTDDVTDSTGYTGTASGTGITNGAVAYFPNTGISTLDFDMAYTGAMTLSQLATLINSAAPTISAASIPSSATSLLTIFASATLVTGMVASNLYPDTAAQAISIFNNGK